jgi:hypothetical protein
MDPKNKIGKRFFIKLKDGTVYNCTITDIQVNPDNSTTIYIKDKFGKNIFFNASEIMKAEETP